MLTAKGQKTKICPYCGTHVDLLKAQKIASANNAFEASDMLRKLKSEQGFNRNKPNVHAAASRMSCINQKPKAHHIQHRF